MKPYSILIHGTGTCGEGNEQSADIALQTLLEQLRMKGHSFASVSMVIDGSTVPIIGAMQPHPPAEAPASSDAVSLVSIARQLQAIDSKCDVIIEGTKKEGPLVGAGAVAAQPVKRGRQKKEGGGGDDTNAQMLNPSGSNQQSAPSGLEQKTQVEEDNGQEGKPMEMSEEKQPNADQLEAPEEQTGTMSTEKTEES